MGSETIMKLMSIAGARPNFMKLASIANAVKLHNQLTNQQKINHIIVHTGQHYDTKMSHSFFEDLGIPKPDINLEVGSGSHAQQTAAIMQSFEPVLLEEKPDALLVVGDVNSTIASTLVAAKIEYPADHHLRRPKIIHVEAGLRSFDSDMPEEINRILTDSISDMLFITEPSGIENLTKEGVDASKIFFTGNVMIDTLQQHLERASQSKIRQKLNAPDNYGLVTLHRPSNVDSADTLNPLINCLVELSQKLPIIFPIHPRTKNSCEQFNLLSKLENAKNITLAAPLGYLDFLCLTSNASVVITDSGGIQEETTFLKIPCVTLRENTERPVTVTEGSNYLIGTNPAKIISTVNDILSGKGKDSKIPQLWDGKAGERIIAQICALNKSCHPA